MAGHGSYDQRGRAYVTDRRSIRPLAVRKADDDLVTVTDTNGRTYQVPRSALQSVGAQVNAGGTTGLGQPRTTGPDAALPADGPQAALPGDVEGRTIIKSLGPQWRAMYDSAGRLRGAVRQGDIRPDRPGRILKAASAHAYSTVCNSAGSRVGIALTADTIPLSHLRTAGRVAKRVGR